MRIVGMEKYRRSEAMSLAELKQTIQKLLKETPIYDSETFLMPREQLEKLETCVEKLQKQLEAAKTLRGNELGWIFKLAEEKFDSKKFQEYLKKNNMEATFGFLNRLMAYIHPNNFDSGKSNDEWLLIKKDEILGDV